MGRPKIYKGETCKIFLQTIPMEYKRLLQELAVKEGRSLNWMVVKALRAFLLKKGLLKEEVKK